MDSAQSRNGRESFQNDLGQNWKILRCSTCMSSLANTQSNLLLKILWSEDRCITIPLAFTVIHLSSLQKILSNRLLWVFAKLDIHVELHKVFQLWSRSFWKLSRPFGLWAESSLKFIDLLIEQFDFHTLFTNHLF